MYIPNALWHILTLRFISYLFLKSQVTGQPVLPLAPPGALLAVSTPEPRALRFGCLRATGTHGGEGQGAGLGHPVESTNTDPPKVNLLRGPLSPLPLCLPVTLSAFVLVELSGSDSTHSLSGSLLAGKLMAGKKVHISPAILHISKLSKSGKGVKASGGRLGAGQGRRMGQTQEMGVPGPPSFQGPSLWSATLKPL